ncbi:MAG: proton-conducting transporter membrane subunit, partial [Nanoarchaeota archaeon]
HYTGSLEIGPLYLPAQITSLVFVLLFIGFGTKAGIIPFHKWLPYAHPASPSPISALMSGVMIKVAIYGLIRFLLLFTEQKLWWGMLILIFGTVSALLGVIYALKEHDIKRLLAYHSIENIGIILIGLGLYSIFTVFGYKALAVLGIAAALFHTLNHALFKSLLFLTAGSVVNATHTKNIEEMGGLMKRMPYTAVLFLIGAISISALPPFNGFVSELMIFQVFFQSYLIPSPFIESILFISLSLLAMTSALAAACFVKAFSAVFAAAPRSEEAAHAKEAPFSMIAGPAILAILCAFLGIFSFQIFSFIGKRIGYSFPIPNLLWVTASLLLFALLTIILIKTFSSTKSRVSETWGCGILSQNGKMEYTASGFSEPIITIFSSIYRTKKINERKFNDFHNANFKEGHAEIKLMKFFEEYLYLPIVKALRFVSSYLYSLQNKVDVNSYIIYSFITIILLMIFAGWVA